MIVQRSISKSDLVESALVLLVAFPLV